MIHVALYSSVVLQVYTRGSSLDVTQQCNSSQDPVVWVGCMGRGGWSAQTDCCDVCEVCTPRLFVDGTEVQLSVSQVVRGIDSIQVDHWKGSEEHLSWRLCQTTAFTIPASSVQVEPIDIHSLWWRLGNILFHHSGHIVVE